MTVIIPEAVEAIGASGEGAAAGSAAKAKTASGGSAKAKTATSKQRMASGRPPSRGTTQNRFSPAHQEGGTRRGKTTVAGLEKEAGGSTTPERVTGTKRNPFPRQTGGSQRQSSGRKRKSSLSLPTSDKRTSSAFRKVANKAPLIMGEYFVCILIIGSELVTQTARNGYQKTIADVMLKLTGLTGIFFVLFLMSGGGGRSSEVAAGLGALIVLGVLFAATKKGVIADATSLVTGQGITDAGTTLTNETSGITEEHGGLGG